MKSYTRTKHTTFGYPHYPDVKEMVMTNQKLCIQHLPPTFYFTVFGCHRILMLFWFLSLHSSLRMQNSSLCPHPVVSRHDYSRCQSGKAGKTGSTMNLRRGSPPYCCRTNILTVLQHPGQSRTPGPNCHSLVLRKHSQSQCSVVL